eukprot:CAMPEP_0174843830 /NCGR_PEP_ID=MMETSP1114-20130205/10766_1 /TAXON_ID=312471 /ORGANISM="Neobodo designis, Strain CCAP 1951/1" /LENGTH=671 /DNA_ID=CAMNT_0016078063 /DNA_START=28 /DNA_END=2043 /DNA_ORIENTATION=+
MATRQLIDSAIGDNDRSASGFNHVNSRFETAIARAPGSFKLWKAYVDCRASQLETLQLACEPTLVTLFARMISACPYPGSFVLAIRWALRLSSFPVAIRILNRALFAFPPSQMRTIWDTVLDVAANSDCPCIVAGALLRRRAAFSRNTPWWRGCLEWATTMADRGDHGEAVSACHQISKWFPMRLGNANFVELTRRLLSSAPTFSPDVVDLSTVAAEAVEDGRTRLTLSINLARYHILNGQMKEARNLLHRELFRARSFDRFHHVWATWASMELEAAASGLIPHREAEAVVHGESRLWAQLRFKLTPLHTTARTWCEAIKRTLGANDQIETAYREASAALIGEGTPAEVKESLPVFVDYALWLHSCGNSKRSLRLLATVISRFSHIADVRVVADTACKIALETGEDASRDVLCRASANVKAETALHRNPSGLWDTLRAVRDRLGATEIVHWCKVLSQKGNQECARKLAMFGVLYKDLPLKAALEFVEGDSDVSKVGLEIARGLFARTCSKDAELLADFARFESAHKFPTRALELLRERSAKAQDDVAKFADLAETTAALQGTKGLKRLAETQSGSVSAAVIVDRALVLAKQFVSVGDDVAARRVFRQAAPLSNPRGSDVIWQAWKRFEVVNGNQTTYEDMARCERTAVERFSGIEVVLDASGPRGNPRRAR